MGNDDINDIQQKQRKRAASCHYGPANGYDTYYIKKLREIRHNPARQYQLQHLMIVESVAVFFRKVDRNIRMKRRKMLSAALLTSQKLE